MRITAEAVTDSQGYTLSGLWREGLRTTGLGNAFNDSAASEVKWKDLDKSKPLGALVYSDDWGLLAVRLIEAGADKSSLASMWKGPVGYWRLECDGRYSARRKRYVTTGLVS